ncbi:MAG TPA: phosphoribosyltransferase family protein, partial [Pseudomonadales bacterium]|nr:phosphoribosyltransferase family protein [Pseudomonadales bacterium]
MRVPFPDRSQAGAALAHILSDYADRDDVTVVGIARGGVPVAAAVAEFLHATLTVMAVEKVRLFNGMVCGAVADPE